ncbi:MAG: type II toxin-antitoxin system PrlF family antitoxin [Alphaproteobacteria bacterium]|nr:type II toxin-antitoxin system PrlF family antitoxin [Alphaproteobacteria bacterium]
MAAAILTSDGQISLPPAVQQALGVSAGDRIEFVRQPNGRYVIMASPAPVVRLKGLLADHGPLVSIKEMNEANARGAAGD